MSEPVVIESVEAMRAWSREAAKTGRSIGFVPTMGALHAGHTSLMDRARKECGAVVVSIYVNPTQFGIGEDFTRYPRTRSRRTRRWCGDAGVDCIFAPQNLYETDARTFVEVGGLQDQLCGISRPGHFRGVATIVTKLFNIVQPPSGVFWDERRATIGDY